VSNPVRILIVEAPYYRAISDELAAGAIEALEKAGAQYDRLEVPGAFEIPAAIAFAAGLNLIDETELAVAYDGYLALGCVIRGETTHYDYVCGESARGLQDLALHDGLAIGFGILTVENEAQAWARAKRDKKNKGGEAANACLAMIALRARFSGGAG
jgi:6,7-dimethyl-8-ribityllumazine synthase